jgi:hypothetical protein
LNREIRQGRFDSDGTMKSTVEIGDRLVDQGEDPKEVLDHVVRKRLQTKTS